VPINLFDELSAGDRERLLRVGRLHETAAGEEIARQGAVGNCLYVLESGELAVVRRVPGNDEEVLETAGPGTLLGELAVLDRRPRSASLRAQRASVVRIIDLHAFETLTLEGGAGGHRILRAVALSVHRRLAAARESVRARVRTAAALCSTRAEPQAPSWSAPASDVAAMFASLPPFSALGSVDAAEPRIVDIAVLVRGMEFALEPSAGAAATILLQGAVSPCIPVEPGTAVSLPVVAPGGFVDYDAVLGQRAGACFWRARSASIVARLPAREFGPESRSGAALLYALCRDMAITLRSTTGLAMHLGMTWG
jgi:CRP/FNR family cyclic AMP-dependent transcriptional regulator